MNEYGHITELPLDVITPDENQPRLLFSEIEELADSIERYGQLQPISVEELDTGEIRIIDGERRWRAMKLIAERKNNSEPHIKTICYHQHDPIIGIILNVSRSSYKPFEMAHAIENIKELKDGISDEKVAELLGKSRQNITDYHSLLRLPQEIQKLASKHNVVPFNKLLTLVSWKASDDEKISEYKRLYKKYNSLKKDQRIRHYPVEKREERPQKDENAIAAKKFVAMTKKIDTTATALNRFKPERITSKEDALILSDKLDGIIKDAKNLKERLKDAFHE